MPYSTYLYLDFHLFLRHFCTPLDGFKPHKHTVTSPICSRYLGTRVTRATRVTRVTKVTGVSRLGVSGTLSEHTLDTL